MATTATRNRNAVPESTDSPFEILDEVPALRTSTGREKSPLRLAMEKLPVGKTMTTGITIVGTDESKQADDNLVAGVRQKAAAVTDGINEARVAAGDAKLERLFSVRIAEDNRVLVTRNEGTVKND